MRYHKLFIMLLASLLCIPSMLCCQPLSDDEKTWLTGNIMKPEANMIFIMKIQKNMLDLDRLPAEDKSKKNEALPNNEEDIRKYILSHESEAEPFIRLYTILNSSGRRNEALKILSTGLTNILGQLNKEPGNLALVNEAIEIYQAANEVKKAKKLLSYFLELNPKNADALATLANLEILTMDMHAARSHIDQAYALDPSVIGIYVAEALYAMYKGLIALNNQTDSSWTRSLSISTLFLEKAEQEHPEVEAPRLARHGLKLFEIFYSAVIRHTGDFKRLEPFKFVLDTQEIKQLKESEAYFQGRLNANKKNIFYPQKCLVLVAVIKGDLETARAIYKKARLSPCVDNDLFRLMSIGEVMQVRFQDAITHMIRSLQVQDNMDDRLMLASLYDEAGNADSSFRTLMQYTGRPDGTLLVARFGYALKAGKIKDATEIYQGLQSIGPLAKRHDFRYYSGVLELLQGKREEARQTLKMLPEEGRFYENVQAIQNHFDVH